MNSSTSVLPTPQPLNPSASAENNIHHCHCFETVIIVIRYRMMPMLASLEKEPSAKVVRPKEKQKDNETAPAMIVA